MKTTIALLAITILLIGGIVNAQELKTIALPAPAAPDDMPLMDAIKARKSTREIAAREVELQDLSNLLWCAFGINRAETGHRTSASARNAQDIDIYTIFKDGIYLYEPKANELQPVTAGDHRADAGVQPYVAEAPLNLIYVSDLAKLHFAKDREARLIMAAIDAGHCSQNVYLYGASAGLAVVVRTSVDREKMAGILNLRPDQFVVMAETIGYPE